MCYIEQRLNKLYGLHSDVMYTFSFELYCTVFMTIKFPLSLQFALYCTVFMTNKILTFTSVWPNMKLRKSSKVTISSEMTGFSFLRAAPVLEVAPLVRPSSSTCSFILRRRCRTCSQMLSTTPPGGHTNLGNFSSNTTLLQNYLSCQ